MFDTSVIPISNPARTRRGVRPDKKRHPRSGHSADVIRGLSIFTQIHNTTTNVICKSKCREKGQPIARTVKLGLGYLQWAGALLARSPLPARWMKPRRCCNDV